MQSSGQGFLLGGLSSNKTGQIYTSDVSGVIAKIVNPWDDTKRIVVLAGNKAVGTKACVLALTNFWKETLEKYKGEDTFAVAIHGFDLDGDGKVDSIEVNASRKFRYRFCSCSSWLIVFPTVPSFAARTMVYPYADRTG